MKLIFLRHGIAEDRALGKEDYIRDLTVEGIKELKRNAVFLGLYLKEVQPVILTSGLNRAVQTAEILNEYGEYKYIAVKDFLATGDFEELKNDIQTLGENCCVLVGHSPILDQWVYEITENAIEFKKAGACEVEITDAENFFGKVNWYLNINEYRRLIERENYSDSFENFKSEIHTKLDEYHNEILKFREIYLREPEEIESVHKLRVKVRQFRSLITLFKPLMKKRDYKAIQDELRGLAQECAYLRELDVLKKEWAVNITEFKEHGLSGEEFKAVLDIERDEEQEVLYSILEKPQYAQKLNEKLENIKSSINPLKTMYLSLDEMVDDVLNTWHDEIEEGYGKIDENDLTIIHALRIKAKKVRYVMEVFGKDKDPEHEKQYKEIKRWQEVLGDITDANRNSDAVLEIARKYPEREIKEEVDLFVEIQKRNADKLYEDFFNKHGNRNGSKSIETEKETDETNVTEDNDETEITIKEEVGTETNTKQ